MKLSRETLVSDLELSVRSCNLLLSYGHTTLGAAIDNLAAMEKHAKGWGKRCTRELMECKTELERQTGDLWRSPEYVLAQLEDTLSSVLARITDVNNRLLRIALKRGVSKEQRELIASHLQDAADRVRAMPAVGD